MKGELMKLPVRLVPLLLALCSATLQAQVNPTFVNGAKHSPAGTSLNTNVSFSLLMTLTGDATLRDSADTGQDVTIDAVIHPESADIGSSADVFLVDLVPPVPTMRDTDGNFVPWDGKPSSLVPALQGVTLADNMGVDVFSGTLGTAGQHRLYVGFMVGDTLYFTPSALKITIQDPPVGPTPPSAKEQAMALFESVISPRIVQGRCIACHVSGGLADNPSSPIFARNTQADHLNVNFEEWQWVKSFRSTNYLLNKVLGFGHEGGRQLLQGSSDFNNLVDFLDLLDQVGQ